MNRSTLTSTLWALLAAAAPVVYGQAPKPEPDVLTLTDDEKLIGHLLSSTGDSVVFKSDMAGQVTVKWSAIKELRSSAKFAAIPKDLHIAKTADVNRVPQGTVAATGQNVEINPGAGAPLQTVPTNNVAELVQEASFQRAIHHAKFTEGWKGAASFGLSLVKATQDSTTVSAAVNLVRGIPSESWLPTRSRTIFNFNDAYGKVTQTGTPTVKTSLVHFDVEQDWYVNPRVFVFGTAAFDHSYSQGLDLQQSYGGGIGLVAIKRANQELDIRASKNYIDQRFQMSSLNKSLVGSTFGETYSYKFPHGLQLAEQGGFTPAWNDTKAYSAFVSAALTFPVHHGFGFNLSALDNFLNDPPPGFKKSSFQFTAGATYSIK
jgi:hypothetical protein